MKWLRGGLRGQKLVSVVVTNQGEVLGLLGLLFSGEFPDKLEMHTIIRSVEFA